jgi:hypothetical protein
MPTFFRVVGEAEVDIDDLVPDFLKGRPPRDSNVTDEILLFWLGISVFDTEVRARHKARAWPILGSFIAELSVPAEPLYVWRRTIPTSKGHHTVWADPNLLVRCVVRAVRV